MAFNASDVKRRDKIMILSYPVGINFIMVHALSYSGSLIIITFCPVEKIKFESFPVQSRADY